MKKFLSAGFLCIALIVSVFGVGDLPQKIDAGARNQIKEYIDQNRNIFAGTGGIAITTNGINVTIDGSGVAGGSFNATNLTLYGTLTLTNNGSAIGLLDGKGIAGATNLAYIYTANYRSPTQAFNIGFTNDAPDAESFVIGIASRATGALSMAVGNEAYATGAGSTAVGIGANATAQGSMAFGGPNFSTNSYTLVLSDGSTSTYSTLDYQFFARFNGGYDFTGGEFRATKNRYSVTEQNQTLTNTIDFIASDVVSITNVTQGVILAPANALAGRGVTVFFTGCSSNSTLSVPWKWLGTAPTVLNSNKAVALSIFCLGSDTNQTRVSIVTEP